MKVIKQLIKREIAGDVILVPVGKTVLDKNGLFILNEVSADIWDMICEGKTREQIIAALILDYDADEQTIRADTEEFLRQLVRHGIIEV